MLAASLLFVLTALPWVQGDGASELRSLAASSIARAEELRGEGRTDEALALLDEALAALLAAGEPDRELVGLCRVNRAYVLDAGGRGELARVDYEDALTLPLPRVHRVAALEHLEIVLLTQGRFARAREVFLNLRALLDETERRVAHANTLALFHYHTGDLVRAREILEGALDAADPALDAIDRMNAMLTLGSVRTDLEDYEGAARVFEEILRETEGPAGTRYERVGALLNLGNVLLLDDRPREAEPFLERARAEAGELGLPAVEGIVLEGLAELSVELGEPDTAIELATRARAIFEAIPSWEYVVSTLHTVTRARMAQGELDAAGAAIAEAERILDNEEVAGLGFEGAARFRSRFHQWSEHAQDLTAARLSAADAADPDGDPDDDGELRAALVAEGMAAAARWKGRMLLEGITGSRAPSPAAPGALARAVGPGRALVEYAAGEERMYAYVLDAGAATRLDLGQRASLEGAARSYLALFVEGTPRGDARRVAELGGELGRRLLAPVLERLDDDTARLVIVPTPALAGLPFEALVLSTEPREGEPLTFSDIRFAGDRFALTYAPSSPVFALLASRPPRSRERWRALILADPVYRDEAPTAVRSALTEDLGRLRSTRDEAVQVARLVVRWSDDDPALLADLLDLELRRSGFLSGGAFDLYLGREASVERFGGDLSRYSLIHCAVHGIVDPIHPARSGLALAWEPRRGGLFTLSEARDLELEGPLVVLSACETARGRILRGEGVQSVAQAFLQAGAGSVIASLWKVRDDEALETMRTFYRGLLDEGLEPAEALRRAKRAMRTATVLRGEPVGGAPGASDPGHPYFWAPFVHVGY